MRLERGFFRVRLSSEGNVIGAVKNNRYMTGETTIVGIYRLSYGGTLPAIRKSVFWLNNFIRITDAQI